MRIVSSNSHGAVSQNADILSSGIDIMPHSEKFFKPLHLVWENFQKEKLHYVIKKLHPERV